MPHLSMRRSTLAHGNLPQRISRPVRSKLPAQNSSRSTSLQHTIYYTTQRFIGQHLTMKGPPFHSGKGLRRLKAMPRSLSQLLSVESLSSGSKAARQEENVARSSNILRYPKPPLLLGNSYFLFVDGTTGPHVLFEGTRRHPR